MSVRYGIREAYKYYRLYNENPVDCKIFRSVWNTFIDKVTDGIVKKLSSKNARIAAITSSHVASTQR
ncbi:hypothetical protein LCGC14_1628690 [marine sediment metagenome]|uniref:Uncharacterized protein n=1 Tax=marine sediment metagenome TaxID=412755 RepID=A0A0F9KIZ4_9ZZZZ